MTTITLAALTLLGCTALGSGGQSEPATEAVWWDDDQTEALFLSEAELNSAPFEQLPLHESDRSALEWQVAFKLSPPPFPLNATGKLAECNPRLWSAPNRRTSDATTLLGHLAQQPISVVGRVRRLTPGWSAHHRMVADLVEVEVREVLRDATTSLEPGSVLTFLNLGGRITVHGATLCDEKSTEFSTPVTGSRYLLVVTPQQGRFVVGMQFPMHGDEVLSQPYIRLLERENYSLTELRSQLNGEE